VTADYWTRRDRRSCKHRVTHNADEAVGWPPTYLQFVRSVPAGASYCDVNEAFNRELHLGVRGLGHAEGGR
jgi:hypothetical protein